MLLCVAVFSSAQPDVTFTIYPVPETSGGIPGITPGPDGALWFTTWNSIWRLTTVGVMTEYPLPDDGIFYPHGRGATDITTGPDGALWFTEGAAYKIGRITTAGVISEYPLSNDHSPQRIATGSDGALWFTEFIDRIGRITVDGTISEFQLTPCAGTCGRYPNGITAGPDGALWFTDLGDGRIHSITTAGLVSDYGRPSSPYGLQPGDIISGPEGALWLTFGDTAGPHDHLGRVTMAGEITVYPVPIYARPTYNGYNNLAPASITTGPDGALWFASSRVSVIGRMSTQGEVTLYPLPPLGIGDDSWISRSITLGPDGALWIGNSGCVVRAFVRTDRTPTNATLASSLDPSVYGQAVAFTILVTANSGAPMGTVTLFDGSTAVGSGTLANGSASIVAPLLPVGANEITAAYQGNERFAPSKSTPLTQTVSPAATMTTLASSINPAATSQSVTFAATVTSQFGGAATGSVVFFSGSQTLGTASLSGNHALLTTSFTLAGTYSISAKYSGDGNNAGSTSSSLSQRIIAATTTALASSRNPSSAGQTITFTATVGSTAGVPPNGETITFKNGPAVLGTAPLSGGTASLMTSSLPAGILTITASYAGDTNFGASTSPALRQVVNSTSKLATSTALVSSLNPSSYGQAVTCAAMVTTSGPVSPTGNVAFRWSNSGRIFTIGTAPLNASGVATLTRSNLNADPFGVPYPMVAVYSGDASNLGSTSAVLPQHVLQTKTAATITSSANPSIQGQAVTFAARITSPTVIATGPVTFFVGSTVLGTAQLSGGRAKFTTLALPVGSSTVKVTYYGNSNIAKSSASLVQTVR
ncbi:MAG: Ig-like domain repeat protein [Terriglobales bacterium]